jgi:pimeloyl-ACP methyl ester carboxylesterase
VNRRARRHVCQDREMAQFENDLSDDSRGALYDLEHSGGTAIIAFGGLWMRMGGLPPFEFFGQLEDVPSGRVFVRDLEQSWYQLGIRGAAPDIRTSAKWLADLLDAHGIQRTVCVGCSAGGFAAIVFGSLIGAAEIHAFGAQTTIARRDLWKMRDRRWNKYLKPMRKNLGTRQPIFDALLGPLDRCAESRHLRSLGNERGARRAPRATTRRPTERHDGSAPRLWTRRPDACAA